MRRATFLAVITLGLAVLALAVAALIRHGFFMPPLSAQTEIQWAAYRLHRWAFLLGEVPLGLGIFLTGYLLRPGRLVGDSLARPLAVVGALVALAALGAAGFAVYGVVQSREPFLQAPWLAVQGGTLLSGLAVLAILAVLKLIERLPGVRVEALGKAEGKSNEEVGNE